MLGIVSEDENHEKIFKPMAGATLGQGVPLGAWCSFEKDVAPSSNWLMAGTTFDETIYPALNLYLGTNKVPSRYDHSRLGDIEDITLSQDSNNPTVMAYDGVLHLAGGSSNACVITVFINGMQFASCGVGSGYGEGLITPFKKGDNIYITVYASNLTVSKVRYYKHPLFIKATSIASDSDKDSILAQIQEYNTYSTEETLTGKTWIENGVEKPIYRRVVTGLNYGGGNGWYSTGVSATGIKKITNALSFRNSDNATIKLDYRIQNNVVQTYNRDFGSCDELLIEYTKTTD